MSVVTLLRDSAMKQYRYPIWLAAASALSLIAATEVPQGEPNRLIHESSPYLRLHAYNPVDWFPWGEEAFEKARKEGKPIFLSIGYTTCYWCHVMEREVFSNPKIADLMNRWFVSVKVDREERPELDEIYMTTTQMLTGHGGWPNSVFLTPELEPFFAGTYFPPEDQQGRPGFATILEGLHRAWLEQRPQVESRARKIATSVRSAMSGAEMPGNLISEPAVAEVVRSVQDRFDPEFGGFGEGPKFPTPASLFLLWDTAERGDTGARSMVIDTLAAMGRGAIFDHLDGGFHRYTLDREWRVPHFEKMLYDNALLGELLAAVASETGDPFLARLARTSFDFLLDTMRLPNGAFKSAIDAETDGVEGAFYLWTAQEVESALADSELNLFAPIFGLDGAPNFEGDRHTLFLTDSYSAHAQRLGLSETELLARLDPLLARLASIRKQRPFPIVDDKVLCDWNGMTIGAFARASHLLGIDEYREAAIRATSFLLTMQDDLGVQLHVWREGQGKIPAFLDDYAFLIRGLLILYEVTETQRWLDEAVRLTAEMEERLAAPGGGYFQSGPDPELLVRPVSAFDGAIPSGNGIAILNLIQLGNLTGKPIYGARAERALKAFSTDLQRAPSATATIALAARTWKGSGSAVDDPDAVDHLAQSVVSAVLEPGGSVQQEGWREFIVKLEIREGWHINANPASLEFLIPTRVTGPVRKVRYPPGDPLRFAFVDERLQVYSSRVAIRGEVDEKTGSLELSYQACDERRCLPPVSRDLTFERPEDAQ
jgi:uncharacterized protein YyaL (SSP411 family)